MKTYTNGNLSNEVYYRDNIEIRNNNVIVNHSNGRIVYENGSGDGEYQYYLKDHLGNVRLSFAKCSEVLLASCKNDDITVINENHYYPFGLKMEGYWNDFNSETAITTNQYNGKEWVDDLDLGMNDYGARWYDPATARWNSVDPLAEKYVGHSPYNYVANNPVKYIDPDGKRFINFDANGNYTGIITKDNWWHNLWFGSRGLITNSDGSTRMFKFADSKNDVSNIQNGVISKVVIVQESQIKNMLINAGAFNKKNRKQPATFLSEAGIGGGAFDFSFTKIPAMFPKDASSNPQQNPSNSIFLIENVAHNQMNFGNFMFGAGGAALGVYFRALSLGAHKNSRFPEDGQGNRIPEGSPNLNGYQPEWDSSDDQFSIKKGYYYARGGGLFNRWFGNGRAWDKKDLQGLIKVGPLQSN